MLLRGKSIQCIFGLWFRGRVRSRNGRLEVWWRSVRVDTRGNGLVIMLMWMCGVGKVTGRGMREADQCKEVRGRSIMLMEEVVVVVDRWGGVLR